MSESKTISLLIPPEQDSTSQDLQVQIQKIVAQKGHFRHVTEQSLLAQIRGKAPGSKHNDPQGDGQVEPEEDETPQKRQERLWKSREEMLERLSYAQNEILCALDFVSLLISKQSVPAQHSMSPALKDAVPAGTLAARVLPAKPLSSSVQRRLASASQGRRLASFRSTSIKLSTASSRLKIDAERETEYWAQIADLTASGWAVSRLPRDSKAIGVHFGFPESAPQFRDRGFALLRQADDGAVILDKHPIQRKRKRLGVYVSRNNTKTAFFQARTSVQKAQPQSIGDQLTDMRDSLFEEELFYEVCREARIMANQGVTTRADSVDLEVTGGCQISLVFAEQHDSDVDATPDSDDHIVAEFVAVALRLLLNAAHQQNLVRRSQKPPPMTLKSRPLPEYALIRLILTHLRHKAEATRFWKSCRDLAKPFLQAGIQVSITPQKSTGNLFESLSVDHSSTLLSEMMLPAKAGCKVSLTEGRTMQVGLATFLGPPLYGSRYETSPVDFGFSHMPILRHETEGAAVSCIRRILLLDLVAHVETLVKERNIPPESEHGPSKHWKLAHPHDGEFIICESDEAVGKMKIAVLPESISIKWSNTGKGSASKYLIWTWTARGCTKADGTAVASQVDTDFDQAIDQIMKGSL
ncbi:hypothetical protein A1O1_01351 [Capronia coronata CBS 617.96]|uniref:Mediator of RNA polymerase II transcription subunit 17 n=1 Tax=Capronia coronata CBS 617.96 TaxID=1182541 RepID=W9Z2N3_9EURO|nr:uncharacterized protein A1O1_01351 [Capronia coronata CBS 617.96]EXJ96225.1 hypothetical protein A1O1_01351 [Capronia coronata CBS 617.96]